jgi:hypothetical protein
MSTTETETKAIVQWLRIHGMPNIQALAIACAIESVRESHGFPATYGTLLATALNEAIATMMKGE